MRYAEWQDDVGYCTARECIVLAREHTVLARKHFALARGHTVLAIVCGQNVMFSSCNSNPSTPSFLCRTWCLIQVTVLGFSYLCATWRSQIFYRVETSSIDTQHGQATWTWNMVMQHGHRIYIQHGDMDHAALTCTRSMDMGMQLAHGHSAQTWTCSMDMDMDMQHEYGRAAWI